MALLSELVALCQEHKVDATATLNVFARRLREAKRISQAGRGRGAAHMTTLDAARFLIACAATDHPERAVDAEDVFSNLKRGGDLIRNAKISISADEAPTLDLALARTLEMLGTGQIDAAAKAEHDENFPGVPRMMSLPVWLRVGRSSVGANLRVLGDEYIYQHPIISNLGLSVDRKEPFGAQIAIAEDLDRETRRFHTGKNLSAELTLPLLQAIANLVCGAK